MKPDPTYERLREIAWRRPLTAAEAAEWAAWLASHPEHAAELEQEAALNQLLAVKAPPRAASNFTAQVWQQIEAETRRETAGAAPRRRGAIWLPRLAWGSALGLALVVGGLKLHSHQQQLELARVAQTLAQAVDLSNPVVLADFEVIRRLNSVTVAADENLLALSDELLAVAR